MKLYNDPRDKRVFVPNKAGGVSLNFGHPTAWMILILMTILPLLIVAGVTIAYLL